MYACSFSHFCMCISCLVSFFLIHLSLTHSHRHKCMYAHKHMHTHTYIKTFRNMLYPDILYFKLWNYLYIINKKLKHKAYNKINVVKNDSPQISFSSTFVCTPLVCSERGRVETYRYVCTGLCMTSVCTKQCATCTFMDCVSMYAGKLPAIFYKVEKHLQFYLMEKSQ